MNDSPSIDTRAIVQKLGADPADYDKVIPLLDSILNGLRAGAYVILRSPIKGARETVMWLEDRKEWGTLRKTEVPPGSPTFANDGGPKP
jgi:hypothetical protein